MYHFDESDGVVHVEPHVWIDFAVDVFADNRLRQHPGVVTRLAEETPLTICGHLGACGVRNCDDGVGWLAIEAAAFFFAAVAQRAVEPR